MTRIISGRFRGRSMTVPRTGTRPTSDRVREALFSALTSRVDLDGGAVLDLFAGSGALGIEALSRGATTAWFVESSPQAVSCLKRNLAGLGGGGARGGDGDDGDVCETVVRRSSLPGAVAGECPLPGGFDLVLADPPYDRSTELETPVLTALADGGWLADDALVVWERSSRTPAVAWPAGFEAESPRAYGETTVELAHYTRERAGAG